MWLRLMILFIGIGALISNKPLFPKQNRKAKESGYYYTTHWFPQTLDHFSFRSEDYQFAQRYLINDDYFKPGAPVFFYTGNEGDITWFCNNTGFMWDIAEEFSAMLVFAEHRYYGESMPFGSDSYKKFKLPDTLEKSFESFKSWILTYPGQQAVQGFNNTDASHLGYLTSEQALADFAVLIDYIKVSVPATSESPFIAFGGSYGGMLAAWFRMKYPASVVGAISSSAPILAFVDMNDCELFYQISTNDFKLAGGNACATSIRNSWQTVLNVGESDTGRLKISELFKLCKPLKTFDDVYNLNNWFSEVWVNLAMVNYPYPANFLEDLPAWPINEVCKHLQNSNATGDELIRNLVNAVNVYFNFTGQSSCLNIEQQASGSLGDQGWDFQACTEMAMPLCQDGIRDMWLPYKYDFDDFATSCKQKWGVTTRKYWSQSQYGGFNLNGASNIVFSNGKLDPWSGYGVLKSQSPTIKVVMIDDGAHHLDLRKSNSLDPQSVIDARNIHKSNIHSWINEYHMQKKNTI